MGSCILGLKRAWVGAHYHAPYSNYARGVSVLVHKSLPFQFLDVKLDSGGRYVIDLAFASPTLLHRVVSAEILSQGISDHAPLSVTFRISDVEGVGVWRLSKYWIMDPNIQEEMKEALCAFWIDNAGCAGPLVVWDALKSWLRGEYMTRIAVRKRQSAQSLRHLEEQAKLKQAECARCPDQGHYVPWQDTVRRPTSACGLGS